MTTSMDARLVATRHLLTLPTVNCSTFDRAASHPNSSESGEVCVNVQGGSMHPVPTSNTQQ